MQAEHEAAQFGREIDCVAPEGAASLPVVAVRPEGLEAALGRLSPMAAGFVRSAGFAGKAGQLCLLPGGEGVSGALLGLGDARSPWSHADLAFSLKEGTAWRFEPGDFDMEQAALGFLLGAYRYPGAPLQRKPAMLDLGAVTNPVRAAAEAIWLARDLINTPANLLGPHELAEATLALGARFGAERTVVTGSALAEAYPAVAAVGRGSDRAPEVAVLRWRGSRAGEDSPHVSLCGKGVCFDSGGYDLKPSAAMLRMKKDMGGAALLLGLAQAVMRLDLPIRLSVRIGCVENMVSGSAMRPLDVLRTRRGISVEVGNTDAEGRLVLCDLLAEASDERPDVLIDAATLTGAARVALGPDLPALFGSHDEDAQALESIGWAMGDPVWRLPLFREYDSWLSSPAADINNVSSKPYAGAIIAALFLRRFVTEGVRWLHLDTYAWNDASRPGRPEGGESQALRALLAYVRNLTKR